MSRPTRSLGAPTVEDVARAAGVSAMTVSRVLNDPARVKQSTRALVRQAITDLDYKPNNAARTLAGARQVRIGLLLNDLGAGFLNAVLVACMSAASRSHVQVMIENVEGDDDPLPATRDLIAARVDGIILPPPLGENAGVIGLIAAARLPMVALTPSVPDARTLSVHIDDYAAAQAMTCHLLALGHRRIGFINGTPSLTASQQRLLGFRDAMAAADMPVDEDLIAQGYFTYQSGLEAAARLLDAGTLPTAIFACNDDMAAAAVAVAHRLGLDVPADIAVCGFDDTMLATTIWPQLTTIRQPLVDMTKHAVAMLLHEIAAPGSLRDEDRNRLFDYALVRRQSDAAPRRMPPPRAVAAGPGRR